MLSILKKYTILSLLLGVTHVSYATNTVVSDSHSKTYTVTDLQRVVSNHPDCRSMYSFLQQLIEKPLTLQFVKNSQSNDYQVQDESSLMNNHHYNIIKQTTHGHALNRIGIGSFEVNHLIVDYVITISADADQEDYQYLYPVILSSHAGHCYYTALVRPNAQTAAVFKKNVKTGRASKNRI